MFYTIVAGKVEEIFSRYFTGEFHVGLDPIKEYVYFYCVVFSLQSIDNKYNLSEFQNMLVKENTHLDIGFYDFIADYNKVAHHYINLNHKTQKDYYERQRLEKQKGKMERFKGKDLYRFQEDEFLDLMKIKHDNKGKLNRTYKRIVSEKGYLSRMTFTDLHKYNDHLYNQIDSGDPYSNIRYYKLEKMLNFELIKSILASLSVCRRSSTFDEENVLNDLLMVAELPLIADRQKYVELYPELNWAEIQIWKEEVQNSIILHIKWSIVAVLKWVQESDYSILDNVDWNKFSTIYAPPTYKSNYLLRKDFSADDFHLLMKHLDNRNNSVRNKF